MPLKIYWFFQTRQELSEVDEEELTMVSPMSRQEAPSFKAGRFTMLKRKSESARRILNDY